MRVIALEIAGRTKDNRTEKDKHWLAGSRTHGEQIKRTWKMKKQGYEKQCSRGAKKKKRNE